jgi:hypothetical protein
MSKQQLAKAEDKQGALTLGIPANPWSHLATELERFLGAPTVKFTKDGLFALSESDNIPAGTKCIARVDLIQTGWKLWRDGAVVKTIMGAVADEFVPPARTVLGETDQSKWENPNLDPWQFNMVMPITRLDTDETYNFVTGSKGGLNAVNRLVRVYGTRLNRGETGLPIVEVRPDSYKHHEYGKIFFPKFVIVSWTDRTLKPLSVDEDLNDEVPY